MFSHFALSTTCVLPLHLWLVSQLLSLFPRVTAVMLGGVAGANSIVSFLQQLARFPISVPQKHHAFTQHSNTAPADS
jgi:hypothetical protein